jgi:hypothetical protein
MGTSRTSETRSLANWTGGDSRGEPVDEANPVLNEKDAFQPSEVNQQIVAAPKRRHVPPTGASGQPTRRS